MRTTIFGLLGVLMLASPLHAQPSGASAQAEAMFRRGKELMAAGKIAEACDAFDASQKLEAASSTRMNQANCREKNGQLATAWALFLDAARQTRTTDKQLHAVATDRAVKLEARLSSVRFNVPAEHRVAGLEIFRDNERVEPATWNTKLPVDGGSFTVTARAPGFQAWTGSVTVAAEKDAKTIDVPRLAAASAARPPEPVVTPPPRGIERRPDPTPITVGPERPSTTWQLTPRRKLAIGVGAGGVVAIVVGGALGASAKGKQQDAEALCPDPATPCAEAAQATALSSQGHDRAFQANVAFVVGGAAVVGAAVLWITGKPRETGRVSIVPRVSPGETGIAVLGRF